MSQVPSQARQGPDGELKRPPPNWDQNFKDKKKTKDWTCKDKDKDAKFSP